jgi:hypothetical protein
LRRPHIPPATPDKNFGDLGYLDFRPGWRIRVVVPILRSGGYVVPLTARKDGDAMSVQSAADFLGYETDYYLVSAGPASGVRISFRQAEAVIQGKTSRPSVPLLQLFNRPTDVNLVRLVHLERESKSDHDVVLLAADDEGTLDKLTAEVRSNDSEMCKSLQTVGCTWVPAGVAVIPEEKSRTDDRMEWVPVK